ncbi:hypothetical protein V2G26_009444 [Clonostachys chloroleuca]
MVDMAQRRPHISLSSPIDHVSGASAVLFVGRFFYNNVSHESNDLIDAPLDALAERTRMRPIPRGDISRGAALVFAFTQALIWLACLLPLPRDTALVALPTLSAPSVMGVQRPWTGPSTASLVGVSVLWVGRHQETRRSIPELR